MNLFYTPDIKGDTYRLSEEESKHCVRVLRMTEGDEIYLTDGVGTLFKTEITVANPKACTVRVIETTPEYEKHDYKLHIALAPTKVMDRTELFLEKCTEIGFDSYTPLESFHSERRAIKKERCEKVVLAAMKQSLKSYKPECNDIAHFDAIVKKTFDGQKFIAHCNESATKKPLQSLVKKGENVLVLIGPEGDFSQEEVKLALENGFFDVSLGNTRLRTETAGIVACHTVALINE